VPLDNRTRAVQRCHARGCGCPHPGSLPSAGAAFLHASPWARVEVVGLRGPAQATLTSWTSIPERILRMTRSPRRSNRWHRSSTPVGAAVRRRSVRGLCSCWAGGV